MLFIGGTKDGQRLYVPWNNGNPVLKIPIKTESESVYEIEIYIKKEILEKKQHIFSVMVKDGSPLLLDAFLNKYNKKIEDHA